MKFNRIQLNLIDSILLWLSFQHFLEHCNLILPRLKNLIIGLDDFISTCYLPMICDRLTRPDAWWSAKNEITTQASCYFLQYFEFWNSIRKKHFQKKSQTSNEKNYDKLTAITAKSLSLLTRKRKNQKLIALPEKPRAENEGSFFVKIEPACKIHGVVKCVL